MARALQVIGIITLGVLAAVVVLFLGPTTELPCETGRAWDRLAQNVDKGFDLHSDSRIAGQCLVPAPSSWVAAGTTLVLVVAALLRASRPAEPPTTGWVSSAPSRPPRPVAESGSDGAADADETGGSERPRWTTAAQRRRRQVDV